MGSMMIHNGSLQIILDGTHVAAAADDVVATVADEEGVWLRECRLKRIKIVENENHAHSLHKEDADMEINVISVTILPIRWFRGFFRFGLRSPCGLF